MLLCRIPVTVACTIVILDTQRNQFPRNLGAFKSQCHRYDTDTPLEETMLALSEVVRSGKVRYIGFSEWPIDRVEAAFAIPKVERFVSSQPQYSLLHRSPERALISLSTRSGISQIVWSPLAQGVLSGKYLPGGDVPRDSRAANDAINGLRH